MADKETPTMTDQGFIDNIVDRVRDLLPKQPQPGAPVPTPTPSDLPVWLQRVLGWLLAAALAFIAAKWNITPTLLPSLQSQPQIVVLQVPAGSTVTAASK
jgi:hypothetical protein